MLRPTFTFCSFLFLLTAILFAGCSDDELTSAIKKAVTDSVISPTEAASLEGIILENKPDYKNLVTGERVNWQALDRKIRWIAKKPVQIEMPETGEASNASKAKYEVYLENSGSMDGYVSGNTSFKNTLHTFINSVQLPTNNLTDEVKLFYINSQILPFTGNLREFILNLNPKSFRERGGDRKTTDFVELFGNLLKVCSKDKVVVFISDCVLSPEAGKSAEDFLVDHRETIKSTFNAHLNSNRDFKTVVIKLKSGFKGTYYDFKNGKHHLDGNIRPYYVWVFGVSEQVDKLLGKVAVPAEAERHLVFTNSAAVPNHSLLMSPRIGMYTRGKDAHIIKNANEAESGPNAGQFSFTVGADLSGYFFDDSHILSAESYKVSPPAFSIQVEPIAADAKASQAHLKNFDHYLKLTTTELKEGQVSIQMKRELPAWVEASSSKNDQAQSGNELTRTYGLAYLLAGVSEAYRSAAENPEAYFTLLFTIEK